MGGVRLEKGRISSERKDEFERGRMRRFEQEINARRIEKLD